MKTNAGIHLLPVPRQYLHLLCSCCLTLFISTTIKADITPTAPPEKDATMGSTSLQRFIDLPVRTLERKANYEFQY